jgi:hypothetical protein
MLETMNAALTFLAWALAPNAAATNNTNPINTTRFLLAIVNLLNLPEIC